MTLSDIMAVPLGFLWFLSNEAPALWLADTLELPDDPCVDMFKSQMFETPLTRTEILWKLYQT